MCTGVQKGSKLVAEFLIVHSLSNRRSGTEAQAPHDCYSIGLLRVHEQC